MLKIVHIKNENSKINVCLKTGTHEFFSILNLTLAGFLEIQSFNKT